MNKQPNKLIYAFIDYLNTSSPIVEEILTNLDEYEDSLSDWMQSSWEILVEAALFYGSKNSLVIYGDGADVCKGSSRVTFPHLLATHRVICKCDFNKIDLIAGLHIDISRFEFEKFVSWNGTYYSMDGNLDSVLLSKGNQEYVVSLDNVEFDIIEITGNS